MERDDELTTSQAAAILHVTPDRVRQLEREGKLPAHRTALGRLFDRAVVEQLARARAQKVVHA